MARMTTRQKIAFAVALCQSGLKIVQACKEMGIHRNTLSRHLRQLGVTPRKAPGSLQADAAVSREVRMRQEWRALNRRMPPNVNGSPLSVSSLGVSQGDAGLHTLNDRDAHLDFGGVTTRGPLD